MRPRTIAALAIALILGSTSVIAQTGKDTESKASQTSILTAAEAAKILPATVFFRGQSAPVQGRNAAGVRLQGQQLMLVSLIDTSGYSSQIQNKYQAYLITEAPLEIEGRSLPPGAYGVGFVHESFIVMDVGAHDLITVKSTTDAELTRPRPLQVMASPGSQDSYRLYVGRSYVIFRASPAS